MFITKSTKKVMAEEQVVDVAPEATDLLFEATDVAEVIAEVTGQDVAVEADGDVVEFTVGEDVYTVEAEGDEEILESAKMKKTAKPINANKQKDSRVVRKISARSNKK